jgi:FKBP-type peptidyl-prolyl cis-trans isomerase
MRRVLRRMCLAGVASVATLVGCAGSSAAGAAPAPVIETTTFAPELAIDLRSFTKNVSGLYYLEAIRGTGVVASEGRKVTFRYSASTPDGQIVESQRDPVEVELGPGMIRGLRQGLAGMHAGGQRRLIIPPSLAYGRTRYKDVPPNTILVFDVELLNVR